jgi:hypothetical protein
MSMNLETVLHWIKEREAIRKRREAGEPPPWTDDAILRNYSFRNVQREHDRVTRHIAQNWREPARRRPESLHSNGHRPVHQLAWHYGRARLPRSVRSRSHQERARQGNLHVF